MECEWIDREDELLHDFQKLLVSRADHRLMIFASTKEKYKGIINDFKIAIKEFEYSERGDRWLFIAFDKIGNLLAADPYIH
ncbi:hypothetical protein ES705_38093 [subsurface metagenome]